ncbi:hypothetical protein AMTRI_Chr05g68460 [Amborella trichopoda]
MVPSHVSSPQTRNHNSKGCHLEPGNFMDDFPTMLCKINWLGFGQRENCHESSRGLVELSPFALNLQRQNYPPFSGGFSTPSAVHRPLKSQWSWNYLVNLNVSNLYRRPLLKNQGGLNFPVSFGHTSKHELWRIPNHSVRPRFPKEIYRNLSILDYIYNILQLSKHSFKHMPLPIFTNSLRVSFLEMLVGWCH